MRNHLLVSAVTLAVTAVPAIGFDETDNLEAFAKANLAGSVQSNLSRGLEGLTDNLEVSISGLEGKKPSFNILKIQPLMDNRESGSVIFLQASANRTNHRNTANIGLGYRKLVRDNTIILGVNGFYDSEWKYDHERGSLGLEMLTSVGDIRFNKYWAISDVEVGRYGNAERALDGYDAELAVPLPYMPRTKIHAKVFEHDSDDTATKIEGETYSLNADLPYGLTLEAGSTSYDGDREDQDFITLSFNLSFGKTPGKGTDSGEFFSSQAFQMTPIVERRFEKVRRANTISKEIGGGLVVTVSGV